MTWKPATPWLPNSTSPYADGAYKGGDRPAGSTPIPTDVTVVPDRNSTLIHWEADYAEHDYYEIEVNGVIDTRKLYSSAFVDRSVANGDTYRVRGVGYDASPSAWTSIETVTTSGYIQPTGTNYYVDNLNGSDANNGLTTGAAFETINFALGTVAAGDAINIMTGDGTYQEQGDVSGGKHNIPVSFVPITNGTATDKIIIRPNFGDEGTFVLDGQNTSYGFFMTDTSNQSKSHYIFRQLDFQNCRSASIGHWDAADEFDFTFGSYGVIIEDCNFNYVRSNDGQNVSHVAFWGSHDWVIRNSTFADAAEDTQNRGSGCQSFQCHRAVVYNNEFDDLTQQGVKIKDAFVNTVARLPYDAANVFENKLRGNTFGFDSQPKGSGSAETNYLAIHNNTVEDYATAGIAYRMTIAADQGKEIRFYNNSFAGTGESVKIDNSPSIKLWGNISAGAGRDIQLEKLSATKYDSLVECDYNIFDSGLDIYMDRYSATSIQYTNLATWQAALSGSSFALTFDNPDPNSIQSTSGAVYTNFGAGDFTLVGSSPALAFMPDGSDAGAYQYTDTVIGVAP